MINLIVLGAKGRMGSTIINLIKNDKELNLVGAIEREELVDEIKGLNCKVTSDLEEVAKEFKDNAVLIDFTYPDVTMKASEVCEKYGLKEVIGTTGLSADQLEVLQKRANKISIFLAPNMSIGINVLLKLLPELLNLLGSEYDVEISEIHHRHKKDAPSGTAIKLAQTLASSRGWGENTIRYCREGFIGERPEKEIGVQTIRGGDVVGEHTVYFLGPGERIDVTHRAYSRETFAKGAIRACKWIINQPPGRLYTMADLLS